MKEKKRREQKAAGKRNREESRIQRACTMCRGKSARVVGGREEEGSEAARAN